MRPVLLATGHMPSLMVGSVATFSSSLSMILISVGESDRSLHERRDRGGSHTVSRIDDLLTVQDREADRT